jgi:hypothetical protein
MTAAKFILLISLALAATGIAFGAEIAVLLPAVSDVIPKPGSPALIFAGLIGAGAIARRRLSFRA